MCYVLKLWTQTDVSKSGRILKILIFFSISFSKRIWKCQSWFKFLTFEIFLMAESHPNQKSHNSLVLLFYSGEFNSKSTKNYQNLVFYNAFDLNNGKKLFPKWVFQFQRKRRFWNTLMQGLSKCSCSCDQLCLGRLWKWCLAYPRCRCSHDQLYQE